MTIVGLWKCGKYLSIVKKENNNNSFIEQTGSNKTIITKENNKFKIVYKKIHHGRMIGNSKIEWLREDGKKTLWKREHMMSSLMQTMFSRAMVKSNAEFSLHCS